MAQTATTLGETMRRVYLQGELRDAQACQCPHCRDMVPVLERAIARLEQHADA